MDVQDYPDGILIVACGIAHSAGPIFAAAVNSAPHLLEELVQRLTDAGADFLLLTKDGGALVMATAPDAAMHGTKHLTPGKAGIVLLNLSKSGYQRLRASAGWAVAL